MSSMFKKKGGPAFKPKIPSARPRPAAKAVATPAQAPKTVDSQIAPDSLPEEPSDKRQDVSNVEPASDTPRETSVSEKTPNEGQTSPEPAPPTDAVTDYSTAKTPGQQSEETSDPINQGPTSTIQDTAPKDQSATEPQTADSTLRETQIRETESRPTAQHHSKEPDSQPTPQEIPTERDEAPPTETQNTEASQNATVAPDETPSAPKPPNRKPRAKRPAATRPKESADGDGASTAPRKRQRKTAQTTQTEDTESEPQTEKRKPTTGEGAPRPRRARSVTPEDAETQTVDLQKLKMADLTRDLHIGKKFSRHDELRERERQARIKAKLRKDGELAEDEEETTDGQTPEQGSDSGPSRAPKAAAASAPTTASGPQFRIVDGQIVVDQSSLVMDRHARAAAAQADMETIEENDFTRLITSSSFMNTSKLKGPNIWTPEETELFYRGLRMFGTDFEMISKMFTNKQRRHIKLKFNREERHSPQRVDAVLIGEKTTKMDIDEYMAHTGSEFESVEKIEAEQRKIQEDFEAERQRVADEQAEIMRKKREELFADDDENGGGKKKKKGKKGKQAIKYGLNGEPITTES